jgi:hypothetical protein
MSLQREEQILLSLDNLGYASRKQLQDIFQLGTDRNAQRVLANMKQYLNSFRHFDNVYYLNKRGRERIGSERVRQKPQQIDHVLLRNDVYIYYRPKVWRTERPIMVNNEVFLIPDVTMELNNEVVFLEVDVTQKMIQNKKKIQRYAELQERMKKSGKKMPLVIWVTISEYRRSKLVEYCRNINYRVFTKKDLA